MSLKQVIIFDEARKVFKKDYKSELGTPYVDLMATQIRETGVGLVISDQIPHMLSDAAKSNFYTIISLSLSNGKDIEDIAKTMRLTREQADVLNKLEVGQGIVKLAGRYHEPFPIVMPYFPIDRYVSDSEVDEFMRPILDAFTIKPRTPLSEVLAKGKEGDRPKAEYRENGREPDDFRVDVEDVIKTRKDEVRDFMIHIEKHPFLNVTERYSDMGLNTYKGNKIQKELLESGYLREIKVGKSTYLDLTDKGMEAIGSEKSRFRGRGSFDHILYQEKIREYYEGLGYNAYVEKDLYGKAIDILVMKPGSIMAFEVELDITDHIIENILRDFTVGVNEVVVVTKKKLSVKMREKIEKSIDRDETKKLSFELIDRYLKV